MGYTKLRYEPLWATMSHYESLWATMSHYDPKYWHYDPLWSIVNRIASPDPKKDKSTDYECGSSFSKFQPPVLFLAQLGPKI